MGQIRCQRKPPPGWPGEPCGKLAKYDVVFGIPTVELPRGMRVCQEHLAELKIAQNKGAVLKLLVRDLKYVHA
jgi:hypothetical protein